MTFLPWATRSLARGLKTGAVLSATTTAAILAASHHETGAPWAALNAVAHIVDGDEITQPSEFSPRESLLGVTVNATAMCVWAVIYEGALLAAKRRSGLVPAALLTAAAWIIDYKIVPPRLSPGIEKKLSARGIAFAYLVLGLTLAASETWNRE